MEETVFISAVRTVTWPGVVTGSQGSVTEGVKLDGRNKPVIKVREESCPLLIIHNQSNEIFVYKI